MDKITKALKKLSKEERKCVIEIIEVLVSGSISALDIKKLKGYSDVYRVRKGSIRIVFQKDNTQDIRVITVDRRSEDAYTF